HGQRSHQGGQLRQAAHLRGEGQLHHRPVYASYSYGPKERNGFPDKNIVISRGQVGRVAAPESDSDSQNPSSPFE
ncbi:MAG TPA: hypothetical protein VFH73_23705, partial [Polyangia bacterium]|nr:hypothetical protein [Polyangia bacterium]